MNKTVCNITTKNIREFTNADTIYISKTIKGYRYNYLCTFEKYERGSVYGKVISVEPNGEILTRTVVDTIVSSRLKNCYLYGRLAGSENSYNHCNWFNPNGTIV